MMPIQIATKGLKKNLFIYGLRNSREPSRAPMRCNYIHTWLQEFQGVLHGPNVADTVIHKNTGEPWRPQGKRMCP
jgi:hypothetical protein